MSDKGSQEDLAARAEVEIRGAKTREELERRRVEFLGRKSALMQELRSISKLPESERKEAGARLNRRKAAIEAALKARLEELESGGAAGEGPDLTYPGRYQPRGRAHPVSFVIAEAMEILRGLGFERAEGPECDTDYYNFVALNTPQDHPARDMTDTFYVDGQTLLRTHTSAVWAHVMEKRGPPLRVACPGRAFRRDPADATHSPAFHQVEGLWIDDKCHFSDLKGVLGAFLREFFGPETKLRFVPSYFPFTEPSAEVSIQCRVCRGAGCRSCARSGWLELLGAGMVHPNILAKAGGDYARPGIRGFAFGVGIERLAMMKYRISDMRWLYENDIRILAQLPR